MTEVPETKSLLPKTKLKRWKLESRNFCLSILVICTKVLKDGTQGGQLYNYLTDT